jgi:TIR domain
MSGADPTNTAPAPSLFLSYASEDREAAKALRAALAAGGVDVWYDESGLDGGDAWDQKIRKQIRECDFFMPVISAQTEQRAEGYFRREWRFAVERTLDMADDHPFLLPVVIDDTSQAGARVPDKFVAVQWLRVPGGQPNGALESLCRRLTSGQLLASPAAPRRVSEPATPLAAGPAPSIYPEFPREEPGQRLRFWFHVIGWALRSAWISFQRLPRWVRILIYVWLAIVLMSRGCSMGGDRPRHVSSADDKRAADIARAYQGNATNNAAQVATQIAREFAADEAAGKGAAHVTLLAVPFGAPHDDVAGSKLAKESFAQTYGRVVVSHHGSVGLAPQAAPSLELEEAVALGKSHHSSYVLYGAIDTHAAPPSLIVRIVDVSDGSVAWAQSYPVAQADPAKVASDVAAQVQGLDDD